MTGRARTVTSAAFLTVALGLVYWHVAARLVYDWIHDGNYSHGFLIVPLALYFVWERRSRLAQTPVKPSWAGLVVLAASILVLLAGVLGSELFLSRVSVIGVLAGIVLFLFGWRHLSTLAFPLAFLLLMIPLPAIVFNQVAFPLQLVASRVGEFAIDSVHIPVLREGNVLVLANTTLEVAEACSGIRSLVSLITLGLVYAYFTDTRLWIRSLIVLSCIPVAILTNGARVAGTGMLAYWLGPAAVEGFFHEFSGWMVFVAAFLMIFAFRWMLVRLAPSLPRQQAIPVS